MKHLNIVLFLMTVMAFKGIGQEDIFQLTIKQPSALAPNIIRVVAKPVSNRSGQISSMQFAVSIPSTASPQPILTATSLISGVTYLAPIVSVESQSGNNYINYTFLGVGDPTTATTPKKV